MTECPLCRALATAPALIDNDLAVVIPDAFPLSPGHHLVVSRRHEPDYFALSQAEVVAVWELVGAARALIGERWQADGFNVGINAGAAAGQTIGHVHVHLIPRYGGDVADPRGGIRWMLPHRAVYWEDPPASP
jgi:diadenosine tetraphosphate (Ap4A) HIT family hydrolase